MNLRYPLRALLSVATVLVVGCQAETFGEGDLAIDLEALQVVSGSRIAGGYVVLSAPWMTELPDTMSIGLDNGPAALAVRVVGSPDRFLFGLPANLPGGDHELDLRRSKHERIPIGRMVIGGFTEIRLIPGTIWGPTQWLPSLPGIIGMGPSPDIISCGSQAVKLDARRATLSPVPNSSTCGYGIGSSYLPGRVLIYRPWTAGAWLRIGFSVTGQFVDSIGLWGSHWPGHELAPGLYLKDEKQITYFRDGPTSTPVPGFSHPEHIAYSADGKWAVSSHSQSSNGLLIVDREARNYHWSPEWITAAHALFQEDGRLVVYGWRGGSREIIAHVDPATGVITDSVHFGPAGTPYVLPVALSHKGWIVLAGLVDGHLELTIRDPESLEEIAHPASASFANSCYSWSTWSVVEDASLRRFYIVGNECTGTVPIATFVLPE